MMAQTGSDHIRSISIETSSAVASVALGQGDRVISEKTFSATIGHGSSLIPTADELCRAAGWRPADLQECYISIGPGSFTGLRVAVTFARHVALAAGVQLVAVPTMEAIAWNLLDGAASGSRQVAVFVEAKKGMVFAATFAIDSGTVQTLAGPEMVAPAEYLARAPRRLTVTGSGAGKFIDLIRSHGADIAGDSSWTPTARGIFALGRGRALAGHLTAPAELVPLYVRRPEAEELWEKRQQGPTKPT